MKRRFFILSAATVGVGLPVAYYIKEKSSDKNSNPLFIPQLLSTFCSEHMLKNIGKNYMLQVPDENGKTILQDLLLTDNSGKKTKATATDEVAALMNNKMNADFTAANTLVLNGWVLSKTEARQCALFSLT